MRTPGNDFELAAGFLYSEGLLRSRGDLAGIAYCVDVPAEQQYNVVNVTLRPSVSFDPALLSRNFLATSSCGVCGKGAIEAIYAQGCSLAQQERPLVRAETLASLPAAMISAQSLFQQTGGLHAAGLFAVDGNLIVSREDVGRHNAVDKVIGERFLAGRLPAVEAILLLSGRAGFELVQKAAMAGIPIVAAIGAPSSLAVETARAFGLTLVGFLRSHSFNVYSGGSRIVT
jgi:FdhD protein